MSELRRPSTNPTHQSVPRAVTSARICGLSLSYHRGELIDSVVVNTVMHSSRSRAVYAAVFCLKQKSLIKPVGKTFKRIFNAPNFLTKKDTFKSPNVMPVFGFAKKSPTFSDSRDYRTLRLSCAHFQFFHAFRRDNIFYTFQLLG